MRAAGRLLAEAIDFASSNASDQRRNAELPDEVLK